MDQSITVLLADGRLIDAKLPDSASLSSSALVAKLVFGDQVTIDCKSIPPVWDNVENMPRSLELQTLRFLREADPQEMMRAIQNPDGAGPAIFCTCRPVRRHRRSSHRRRPRHPVQAIPPIQ